MANIPVRRERTPEGGVIRRSEWFPGSGSSAPWDYSMGPWSMMRRFNDEMDRWFNEGREVGDMTMWSPNIDVRERDNNVIINADLPGLNKDDVKIEVTDEGLCIRGERKREHEERREGYHRTERSYGTFCRVVAGAVSSLTRERAPALAFRQARG